MMNVKYHWHFIHDIRFVFHYNYFWWYCRPTVKQTTYVHGEYGEEMRPITAVLRHGLQSPSIVKTWTTGFLLVMAIEYSSQMAMQ
jgi:hypothetical protein